MPPFFKAINIADLILVLSPGDEAAKRRHDPKSPFGFQSFLLRG